MNLRPHHLLCIQNFTGYGYNSDFTENMKLTVSELRENPDTKITFVRGCDDLCVKCPNNMGSWEFFDLLLEKANVVGTPGEGFGCNGEGFFRLTAFGSRENTIEAMERIKKVLK